MKWLSLFAGIGGFDLALEWAGAQVAGQCEIDPYCLKVLQKHWPQVWRWNDIRTLTGDLVREHCGRIDGICGGFPCQDLSVAGKQAGLEGERSGLWFHLLRVIRETGPAWCLIENVPGLLHSGIDIVLGGLEEAGYETWTHLLGSDDIGAAHRRKRVWIVARYTGASAKADAGSLGRRRRSNGNAPRLRGEIQTPGPRTRGVVLDNSAQCQNHQREPGSMAEAQGRGQGEHAALGDAGTAGELVDPNRGGQQNGRPCITSSMDRLVGQGGASEDLLSEASESSNLSIGSARADPDTAGRRKRQRAVAGEPQHAAPECGRASAVMAYPQSGTERPGLRERSPGGERGRRSGNERSAEGTGRLAQPGLGGEPAHVPGKMDCYRVVARPGQEQFAWEAPRTAKGIKNRSARLKSLGNAIVPHCAYLLIKAIESIEE